MEFEIPIKSNAIFTLIPWIWWQVKPKTMALWIAFFLPFIKVHCGKFKRHKTIVCAFFIKRVPIDENPNDFLTSQNDLIPAEVTVGEPFRFNLYTY